MQGSPTSRNQPPKRRFFTRQPFNRTSTASVALVKIDSTESNEEIALEPFSATRCLWNAEAASDPKRCRGYLNSTILFESMKFECETPEIQILNVKNSPDKESDQNFDAYKRRTAMDYLIPSLCLVVTVGNRVVFRSTGIILKNDVLERMGITKTSQQITNGSSLIPTSSQSEKKNWIYIEKTFGTNSHTNLIEAYLAPKSAQFEGELWKGSFDLHHPYSIVGIHLVSIDPTTTFADDEIVSSKFIQAVELSSQPNVVNLEFLFHFPLSNLANDQLPITRRSRECRITLTLRIFSHYISALGSLPAFALDKPNSEVFRSGPDSAVRLLSAEFAPKCYNFTGDKEILLSYQDSHEDIQTTMKHVQLFIDILVFWSSHVYSVGHQILLWNRPVINICCVLYIYAFIKYPSLLYPLILILIPIVLALTRRLEDPISSHIVELYSNPRHLQAAQFKTTFQTEEPKGEAEKTFQTEEPKGETEKSSNPMATGALIKTLIQSAIPSELVDLSRWVRPLIITWLPIAVLFHCTLTWKPSPMEESFKVKCYLQDIPSTDTQSQVTRKELWRDDPFFESAKYQRSKLRQVIPISSDPLLICYISIFIAIVCYLFTERFLYSMFIINVVWYTHMLIKNTSIWIALKRATNAVAQWISSFH